MTTNDMSPALSEAFELFQSGDVIAAETLLIKTVEESESQYGSHSAEFASANYELASMLSVMGREADAITAMRRACEVSIPDDTQATRDRLTYLMQLGELHERRDELDEAESVLRTGLSLREEFYGREHPGYAFGLEPLASVMMNQGELSQALELVEETIDNFWRSGHPRVATAFPLRAIILEQLGNGDDTCSPFDGLDELPDSILEEMVSETFNILDIDRPVETQNVLDKLLPLIERRLGGKHAATIQLQTQLANTGRDIGAAEGRIETIERVLAAHTANGDEDGIFQTLLGLAMAHGETGNPGEAEQTYLQAASKAEAMNSQTHRSQALRNLGLLYSELERTADAEQTLRLATGAAKRSGDSVVTGRSLVALGIFLQHNERLNEAEPLLREAISLLEPLHPDGLCARSHLNAIENHQSCGCGDMSDAMCEALEKFLLDRIPNGMVKGVDVSLGDEDFEISIEAGRDLDDTELDLLDRTIKQTMIDFRRQIGESD